MLACLLWASSMAAHHGRAKHHGLEAKEKEGEEAEFHNLLQGYTHDDLKLQTRPLTHSIPPKNITLGQITNYSQHFGASLVKQNSFMISLWTTLVSFPFTPCSLFCFTFPFDDLLQHSLLKGQSQVVEESEIKADHNKQAALKSLSYCL
jgi:hypothetical protein